jgi:hypothetical protein
MKIEITDREVKVFVDAAYLNLDYWIFEANACEYYKEILGTLVVLKKVGPQDTFYEYLRKAYSVFKRRGSTKVVHSAQELFPELIRKVELQ